MLTRGLIGQASALLLILTYVLAQPELAVATDSPTPGPGYVQNCNPFSGKCRWILRSDLKKAPTGKGIPGHSGGKKAKPACEFGGAAQVCTDSELGNWSNSQQCYMKAEGPQPPKTDPRWAGHTDGSIWACVREQGYDDGRHYVTKWVWLPGPPDTVVADPLTLAYKAVASMQLAAPRIGTAPGPTAIGLVNMPVWLWVTKTESTWGPITRDASVPGLTVTATARVKSITWTMGDGQTVSCEGPGTPYDKAYGVKESPTCGHHYRKTSRDQPNCRYNVTARADWDITWRSTLGDTGQLSMTRQAAVQLRIGEARPVLVDPDGSTQVNVPDMRNDGC
jgi:hypothetical protein